MRALFSNEIGLGTSAQNHRLAGKKARFPIHGTLDNQDKCLCLWRLLSCPVTGVILGLVKAGREKTSTLFHVPLGIQDKSLLSSKLLSCPVTSVTETWKVLWQSSATREKTRAFFLATFGILAFFSVFEDYSPVRSLASLNLQSLRLLFCLVTGVTEASVFETTLLSGHWRHWGFCLW